MRSRGRGGTFEEPPRLVEGHKVEGVGGQLHICDDAMFLVDGELQFHPTPVEVGTALGVECAPAAVEPFVGGEPVMERLDRRLFDKFRVSYLLRLSGILRLEGFPQPGGDALRSDRRVQVGQVHHPALH